MKYIFICFFFLLVINSCYSQDSTAVTCIRKIAKYYGLEEKMIWEWNIDSLGCKGYRANCIDKLQENPFLIGMPKSLFLEMFGKANKDGAESLEYFTSA